MTDRRARHRQLCEEFASLADLDASAQKARLEEIKAADPERGRQLSGMLAIDDQAKTSTLLSEAVVRSASVIVDATPDRTGLRLGPFVIERLLASGGMGQVYEARQEAPSRVVALKLMDARMVSRSVLSRFRHETELMARLVHPGIAQIYEAGTQLDEHHATPWFAMELVPNAVTIVEFACVRQLNIRQRLELFLRACEAVHFGHGRGVIHRDLKPGNILVDRASSQLQPKVIDFGIARSLDSDVTMVTQHTEAGQIVGTLQYMSPEQLSGDVNAIDVRSDVYALGLILFELLTDRRAFDLTERSLPEAVRRLTEAQPPRLRDAAPEARRALLDGDLQTIVSKAIERDPARRYPSVTEFAHDLTRFLSLQPISARPPSALYTARLFAQRHRAIVCGAGIGALALVLGLAGTAAGLVRARFAENQAEVARDAARYESYIANIVAAEAALRTHDLRLARERLAAAPTELRGWEWRHLFARTDRSLARMPTGLARPRALVVSPDGSLIVAGDLQGQVRAYDMASLEERWRSKGPTEVRWIAFSREQNRVAITFDRREVAVLDGSSGRVLAQRAIPDAKVAGFTADDDEIVVVTNAQIVHHWNIATGVMRTRESTRESAHASGVASSVTALSPNGRLYGLLKGSAAEVIRVEDGEVVARLDPEPSGAAARAVDRFAFAADSRAVAAIIDQERVMTMDLTTGRSSIRRVDRPSAIAIARTAGSNRVITGLFSGAIERFSASQTDSEFLLAHELPIGECAFTERSPHGACMATIDWSGVLRLWANDTRDIFRHRLAEAWVYCVAFAPDGAWFVATFGESPPGAPMVARFETRTGAREWAAPSGPPGWLTMACDVNHDGTLVVQDGPRTVAAILRDARDGMEVCKLDRRSDSDSFPKSSFRPGTSEIGVQIGQGRALFPSCHDTDRFIAYVLPKCNEFAMSDDGRRVVLSPMPGTGFVVFDVESGSVVVEVPTTDFVWSIDFSPDGRFVAARLANGEIGLWSSDDWTLVRTWNGDGYGGDSIAFEPAGRLLGLVVGGLRVWDVESGRELVTLPLEGEPASKIAVSANGIWAGVGGTDGTVTLFDAPRPSAAKLP